ncbi:hypothetical protein B0T26DRAFT_802753 [Lasiosphaeria miniovina]|uniref:Uncharacterized protein n=1 Tax=Lasiosphaeria miniovina TaxID=1954250 RepID=A0AA40AKU5_9PEZI|nr:uncharacterized protein B0T26DRAFT_802753 [Lasiosphaeria miniovina]KAK0717691.1 hypothetical protein B0T26DRAFT_802753 [Lasiosphaeria miniovina]
MLYHLKDGETWDPSQCTVIPVTKVLPVMFLSRFLVRAELRYGPSELEVAALVWSANNEFDSTQAKDIADVKQSEEADTSGAPEDLAARPSIVPPSKSGPETVTKATDKPGRMGKQRKKRQGSSPLIEFKDLRKGIYIELAF